MSAHAYDDMQDDKDTAHDQIAQAMTDIMPLLQHLYNRHSSNLEDRETIELLHQQYSGLVDQIKGLMSLLDSSLNVASEFQWQRNMLAQENDRLREHVRLRSDVGTMLEDLTGVDQFEIVRALRLSQGINVPEDVTEALREALDSLIEDTTPEEVAIEDD